MEPEQVARAMYDQDASAAALGIELVSAGTDGAVARMTVRPDMCNGLHIMHGGMTFLLADSAMAFASNAANVVALASSAAIDWLAPVEVGQVVTATAVRRAGGGRSSLWDISVTVDDGSVEGTLVALVRGRTRQVGRPVVSDGRSS
ncbi:MAG: hotdog fold thioesterase [Ilumatobacteraceae bacterium]